MNRTQNVLKALLKTAVSPQTLIAVGILVMQAHPAMAVTIPNAGTLTPSGTVNDGGAASAIDVLRTHWALPILTAVAGIAWLVGAMGHMFRPEKKELLTTMTGVGAVGFVGAGGSTAVMLIMNQMATSASGVLIHGAAAAHIIHLAARTLH